MNNLKGNIWNYRLTEFDVKAMNLAEENYSDPLFIHPPLFVYSLAIFKSLGLPLPLLPVLCHVVVLILIPKITLSITSLWKTNNNVNDNRIVSGALMIFSICPIAAFCSQKIWIDNMLMMTITIAATGHMYITNITSNCFSDCDIQKDKENNYCTHSSIRPMIGQFLSGFLLFGGLSMNTKITSLALLPFLASYTSLIRFYVKISINNGDGIISDIMSNCISLTIGTIASHLPWVYYYHNMTGRWLPNAWPSKSMIEKSLFLQNAISKSQWYYVVTLFKLSPFHGLGLLLVLVLVLVLFIRIIYKYVFKSSKKTATTTTRSHGVFPNISSNHNKSPQRPLVTFRTLISSSTDTDDNYSSNNFRMSPVNNFNTIKDTNNSNVTFDRFSASVLVLSIWPLTFLIGLSILGRLGAGYQTRFILPILPATSVLASILINYTISNTSSQSIKDTLVLVLVSYSAMHLIYYGIMFPPFFADLEYRY